jgi:hypothetical protein
LKYSISSIKNIVPLRDRDLFKKIHFGLKHPYTGQETYGLWLAKRLPGGVLWVRSKDFLKGIEGKVTILHEYGHQVWDYKLTDKARRIFKKVHISVVKMCETPEKVNKLKKSKTPSIDLMFFYERALDKDVEEAFAEAYSYFHVRKWEPSLWKQLQRKSPEITNVFIKVKDMRK